MHLVLQHQPTHMSPKKYKNENAAFFSQDKMQHNYMEDTRKKSNQWRTLYFMKIFRNGSLSLTTSPSRHCPRSAFVLGEQMRVQTPGHQTLYPTGAHSFIHVHSINRTYRTHAVLLCIRIFLPILFGAREKLVVHTPNQLVRYDGSRSGSINKHKRIE